MTEATLSKILINGREVRFRELDSMLEDLNNFRINHTKEFPVRYKSSELLLKDTLATTGNRFINFNMLSVGNVLFLYANDAFQSINKSNIPYLKFILFFIDINPEYDIELIDSNNRVETPNSLVINEAKYRHRIAKIWSKIKISELYQKIVTYKATDKEIDTFTGLLKKYNYDLTIYRRVYAEFVTHKIIENKFLMLRLDGIAYKASRHTHELNRIILQKYTKRGTGQEVAIRFKNRKQLLKDIQGLSYVKVTNFKGDSKRPRTVDEAYLPHITSVKIDTMCLYYSDNELSSISIKVHKQSHYNIYFEDTEGNREELNGKLALLHMICNIGCTYLSSEDDSIGGNSYKGFTTKYEKYNKISELTYNYVCNFM